MIYPKTHICYNKYALQKSLKKRKRSSYFFGKSVKIEFGYKSKISKRISYASSQLLSSRQGVCPTEGQRKQGKASAPFPKLDAGLDWKKSKED